ncbi:UbiH/UbiF family hydroxylase [Janthinobacterium sp. 17J80-10]|uniref:UbiH/UbiF family hydroxylase n=1 Tax=Janthinobacterium sp. 17J80-10 TaxID=2497863 RepID=UPI001005A424|nr:UbiH/UbiF family hydroxylase [Janthinobacterium sp. 17J80-10]QAU35794.1 oxygenase [Janthinobacterium sp. 17J80-10]
MHSQTDICIIGNGVIGKVAALGLAQAGLRVSLLCGTASPAAGAVDAPWDVRVYAVNHVAHKLLSSVKVWDALHADRIAPVDAMDVRGDGTEPAGHLAFDSYGARVGELAWIVEDANLNQALDAALKFASNVHMVHGRAVQLQTDTQAAQVSLDNGDTLSAALLVGADGAHSWVRHQCEIGMDYRPYGQRAIVTNFTCEKPHRGVAYQWFAGEEGIIALLPLPGERVSLVWSAPEVLAERLLADPLEQLAQRLGHYCAGPLGRLTPLLPEAVKSFPLALIRPHAITAPRVALVGDAAHVVHPLAGHGMNLGFADVATLLKVLDEREPQRDCGDARVLGRYARARKEDILLMQLATDGLERLFASDFAPLRIARNLGLNFVDRLPFVKRQLISHALGRPS